jgi:hypothetical protein
LIGAPASICFARQIGPTWRAAGGRDGRAEGERAGMASAAPLTPAQLRARERWQGQWGLPILLAAVLPLFVTSPKTHWVAVAVGFGS